MQFAYRANRSMDDGMVLGVQPNIFHWDKRNTYKGNNSPLCRWIYDYLTGRPLVVRTDDHTSSTVIPNTGTQAPSPSCSPRSNQKSKVSSSWGD